MEMVFQILYSMVNDRLIFCNGILIINEAYFLSKKKIHMTIGGNIHGLPCHLKLSDKIVTLTVT